MDIFAFNSQQNFYLSGLDGFYTKSVIIIELYMSK